MSEVLQEAVEIEAQPEPPKFVLQAEDLAAIQLINERRAHLASQQRVVELENELLTLRLNQKYSVDISKYAIDPRNRVATRK